VLHARACVYLCMNVACVGDSGLDATNCLLGDGSTALSTALCNECQYNTFFDSNGGFLPGSTCSFTADACVTGVTSHRKLASYWAFADATDDYAGHVSLRVVCLKSLRGP